MVDLRAALSRQPTPPPRPTDPIELFRLLKIRTGSPVKEMWAPQADALRDWHAQRTKKDVLFQLNTGAGKTLIGLVAAQSLVNETKGKVVYCCATRQLVEQTRLKAEELGIPTATYIGSGVGWVDREVYQAASGPVVTTYAALFNGKSIFKDDALAAAIFDDAHTAHDAVRGAFTLTVERAKRAELYDGIVSLVHGHFKAAGRGFVYDAVVNHREPSTVLFVPMFELHRHADAMRALLLKHGATTQTDLTFAWAHLGERLDRCALTFNSENAEFTPLLPPVSELRAFRGSVRRIYLSATMRVNDEFVRTFGRAPEHVIAPGGRAGDSERLFLLARSSHIEEATREWAEEATRGLKTVVMTPSQRVASEWGKHAELFEKGMGHARVQAFAASTDERLVFVARYDGIDLPDDACRVMVVDGLPAGISLLDRFFEQHLERSGISDAKIASRFVQILGRTSRGMSDYGAVLLTGRRLLDWVLPPAHRMLLPDHVQRQLAVGERLSDLVHNGTLSARELIEMCLRQDAQWTGVYATEMSGAGATAFPTAPDNERGARLAAAERASADALWNGNYEAALAPLLAARTEAFAADRNLGAWFLHWAGFSSQLAGDGVQATDFFRQAALVKRDLGMPPGARTTRPADDATKASSQAERMALLLKSRGASRVEAELIKISADLRASGLPAGAHEEAIRLLGEYLGYEASRPERETKGKGPDALWVTPSADDVVLFDAKTKKSNKHYEKDLIGKSAQHALWAAAQYPSAERRHYLVGPRVPAVPQATPPASLRVVRPDELARVADELTVVYRRAGTRNLPGLFASEIEEGLKGMALTWQTLHGSMETVKLENL